MSSSPAQALNLYGVLSESRRIIAAHSRHFLALSVLFLLPLSFSLIIYPTFYSTLSQSTALTTQTLLRSTAPIPTNSIILPLLYALFVFLFSLSALATITYSTYHGFYGRPVKLFSAIKSLFHSFLPLISTAAASQLIVLLISLVFLLFVGFVTKGFEILGSEIDYSSNYYIGFCVVVSIVLLLVLIYLQVNWALAHVIVVVESKWGFEPLWRSAYLMRGMKSVSVSLLLLFGVSIGFLVWGNSTSVANLSDVSGWWSWAFVLQTVISSSAVTLLMLNNVATNTVLYVYSKALHGELAFEIAEEFAREYVSLPFDDEKLPHVVSVVQA